MTLIKKVLVGLMAVGIVAAYPAISSGKSKAADKIILSADSTVVLNGEVNAESVANTIAKLREMDGKFLSKNKPIYLVLYTPGGSIQAGLELIEGIRGLDRKVNAVVIFAASMGFQITQSTNTRYILQHGALMSHRAAGEFQGSFGGSTPSQLDSRYGFWLQRVKELDEQTVSRTNGKQTMESYLKQYANETWLTGSQSVEQGYADQIASIKCDKSLDGYDDHVVSFLGINIAYQTSKCPLITAPLNVKLLEGQKLDERFAEEIKSKFVERSDLEKTLLK